VPVHVSIHDVSPASKDRIEEALSLCEAAGARPALLVVPDYHGRAPLLDDGPFCARLRELQAGGHEIYLHGLTHQSGARSAAGGGPGRLSWLLTQRLVSNGEAELADVGPDEGRARVDEGQRVLGAAGLRVDGFVAPAWSMPAWLLPALAERGVGFTEDHLRVYDPAGGRTTPSVLLNWATRSPARLVSTLAWCQLAKHARRWLPARIAIHPADLGFLAVRRQIEALLTWGRGDFVSRGAELLDSSWRTSCDD
jgi:predicted deacetylase